MKIRFPDQDYYINFISDKEDLKDGRYYFVVKVFNPPDIL